MNNRMAVAGIMMVMGLMAFAAVAPASGQTTARFEVPFPFVAGDQVLPAGEYRATISAGPWRLELRLVGEDTGAYLVAIPTQLTSTQSIGKLVFNKYGITPVLKGVRMNGRTEGIEIPSSKTEHELARLANTSLLSRANTKLVVDEVQSR